MTQNDTKLEEIMENIKKELGDDFRETDRKEMETRKYGIISKDEWNYYFRGEKFTYRVRLVKVLENDKVIIGIAKAEIIQKGDLLYDFYDEQYEVHAQFKKWVDKEYYKKVKEVERIYKIEVERNVRGTTLEELEKIARDVIAKEGKKGIDKIWADALYLSEKGYANYKKGDIEELLIKIVKELGIA